MWTQVEVATSEDVGARSSHQVSVVGDALYLFGGEKEPRIPVDNKLYKLQLGASGAVVWETVECKGQAPPARVGHAQTVIGKHIYVHGGRQGITMEEAPLDDLFCFDTESNEWSVIKAEGAPVARSFHQLVSIKNQLFVFGGCAAKGRLNDLFSFDLSTRTWSKLASCDAIVPRGGAALAPAPSGDGLFLMGGFGGYELSDIWLYDLHRNEWALSDKELPRARSVTSCDLVGNNVVIVGGEVNPSDRGHEGAGGFDADVTLVNAGAARLLENDGEQNVPPRGWASGSAWGDDRFVIAGGLAGDDKAPVRLDDVWVLSLQ